MNQNQEFYKDYLLEEVNNYKQKLEEFTQREKQLLDELYRTKSKYESLSRQSVFQKDEITILKRKCILFKRERDCYSRFISSYEEELHDSQNNYALDLLKSLESNFSDYLSQIDFLKLQLDAYKKQHDDTAKMLSQVNDDNESLNAKYQKAKDQIKLMKNSFREEETRLLSEIENLKDQLKKLEVKENDILIDEGQEIRNYRIIHLMNNPLSSRISKDWKHYNHLKEENKELLTRLQLLQSGVSHDITRIVREEIDYSAEISDLKAKLELYSEKYTSLQKAFREKSKEFREVVFMLTGYRFEFEKHNIYKLYHVYSDSQEPILLFSMNESNTMNLLENSLTDRLTDSIDLYLAQHDSFPAFLASVTLDLFKKQTIVATAKEI